MHSPEADLFIDFLEAEERVPLTFHFSTYPSDDWWKLTDDRWIGAIPTWNDFVYVSPANTFDPAAPPPCFGIVPSHLPLHVLDRPRTHVVGVKNDEIFSESMAAFLASLAPCQFGDVLLQDNVLRTHCRVFPQRARKVLTRDLVTMVRCTACGSPILSGPGGTRLGRRVDDLVVCSNEDGVGHLAGEHPIIVSIAVAQMMKERFPRGYGFEPILDIDSSDGRRIAHLFQRLQRLEASCPLE